jgi:hypothetical protein
MDLKIGLWVFVPPQDGELPGMPSYKIAGTVNGEIFMGVISLEIDGRDAEYEPIRGIDLRDDFDLWDQLPLALEKAAGWAEDFEARAEEYYAS